MNDAIQQNEIGFIKHGGGLWPAGIGYGQLIEYSQKLVIGTDVKNSQYIQWPQVKEYRRLVPAYLLDQANAELETMNQLLNSYFD